MNRMKVLYVYNIVCNVICFICFFDLMIDLEKMFWNEKFLFIKEFLSKFV